MPDKEVATWMITNPQASEWRPLLRAMLSHLEPSQQRRQLREWLPNSESAASGEAFSGLFVARSTKHGTPAAAVWFQSVPGRTAAVGPPHSLVVAGERWLLGQRPPPDVQRALLRHGLQWARGQGLEMVQAVLEPDDLALQDILSECGFEKLVDLQYLSSPRLSSDLESPDNQVAGTTWHFQNVPPSDEQRARWCRLLDATYLETRDCPALAGRRSLEQTLEGYCHTASFLPEGWLILTTETARPTQTAQSTDLGCLILADHPEHEFLEVVYFGLVPTARGRGWGARILERAAGLARRLGRYRLIAALDTENLPAQRIYAGLNYEFLAQKRVYAHFLSPHGPAIDRAASG